MTYFHGPKGGLGKTIHNNDFLHSKVDSVFSFLKNEIMTYRYFGKLSFRKRQKLLP